MPHPCVYFVITGWKLDSFGGNAPASSTTRTESGERRWADRIRRRPSRRAGAPCGLGRQSRSPVRRGDQLFDNPGPGPPRGDVQRRAITSEMVINATFEMAGEPCSLNSREMGIPRASAISWTWGERKPRDAALVRRSGSQRFDGFCLIARTGGDQRINCGEVDWVSVFPE